MKECIGKYALLVLCGKIKTILCNFTKGFTKKK